MGYPMQLAQVPGGGTFNAKAFNPTTGQTFIRGAVVIFDGGSPGNIKEATTGPTTGVLGVALQGVATGPGNQMANSPATITWQELVITVGVADNVTIFQATGVNGSATRVVALATDVGKTYGLSKYTDWAVDKSLTGGSACVTIVEVDLMRNLFLFKFLAAAIAGV